MGIRLVMGHVDTSDGHLALGMYWLKQLDSHEVWYARVHDYADLELDPQIVHAGLTWSVPVGRGGETFRTVGSPFAFSKTPPSVRRGVPRAGEHNAEIIDRIGDA
jgi:crotonobetainyl-CoA:carnitine CoA-transferase CaiB-like acyl-CoA transferase